MPESTIAIVAALAPLQSLFDTGLYVQSWLTSERVETTVGSSS